MGGLNKWGYFGFDSIRFNKRTCKGGVLKLKTVTGNNNSQFSMEALMLPLFGVVYAQVA